MHFLFTFYFKIDVRAIAQQGPTNLEAPSQSILSPTYLYDLAYMTIIKIE